MRLTRSAAAIAALLPLTAACSRAAASPEAPRLDRSCERAVAAPAAGDVEIARLQEDLRERRSGAGAAERLGYRFVARARLTNDPGVYALAEQAAACLESMQPNEPAALLLKGHVLHQMHRF